MNEVVEINITNIVVGHSRSCEIFPNESIKLLADSIKRDGHILNPLIVREVGGKFELVCGLKRLKAAIMNSLLSVPCNIRSLTDQEATRLSFEDNLKSL